MKTRGTLRQYCVGLGAGLQADSNTNRREKIVMVSTAGILTGVYDLANLVIGREDAVSSSASQDG